MKKQKVLFRAAKLCLATAAILAAVTMGFSQRQHPAERDKVARSIIGGLETSIFFRNESDKPVKLFWFNEKGERVFFMKLDLRQEKSVRTYLAQPWLVTDAQDNALSLYYPDGQPRTVIIGSQTTETANRPSPVDEEEEDEERAAVDTKPVTVCSNQEVPRGFFIISAGSDWNCPNWSATAKNTYTIRRADRKESLTVCSQSFIPKGFVVTQAGNNWNCPNWSATGKNTYTIKRPGETEEICSVSETPRRYLVVSEGSNWNCPDWSATGKNTKRIRRID